jgi:hypothetical protein
MYPSEWIAQHFPGVGQTTTTMDAKGHATTTAQAGVYIRLVANQ